MYALRLRNGGPGGLGLLAAAAAALLAGGVHAAVTPGGTVQARLAGAVAARPGDLLLPGDELWIGLNTPGTLAVGAGSTLRVDSLALAQTDGVQAFAVPGINQLTLDGAGTQAQFYNLGVGFWGQAAVAVTNGALMDGRFGGSSCPIAFCTMQFAPHAGSSASLTVSGAGSVAQFRPGFTFGGAQVSTVAANGFLAGTPGGTTTANLQVLGGGVLRTYGGALGTGASGASNGQERVLVDALVSGSNSRWEVSSVSGSTFLSLGSGAATTSTLEMRQGGRLAFSGNANVYNSMVVGGNGARGTLTLRDAGSGMDFSGDASVLNVGSQAGSNGSFNVLAGADVSGLWYLGVGRSGSTGTAVVDGAGSVINLTGTASAAANTTSGAAFLEVGRQPGSQGSMTVSNGGLVSIQATAAFTGGPGITVGRDAGATGILTVAGANSRVLVSAQSVLPGGGAGEAVNPVLNVGRLGNGHVSILAGGRIELAGGAVSTTAASRSAVVNIGGVADSNSGGTGSMLVTGAGSTLAITGSDPFLAVGRGAGATGTLTVDLSGQVLGRIVNIGRAGGTGTVTLDNGSMLLSGQQTGNTLSGAGVAVGAGGTGTMTMTNGALLRVDNSAGTVAPGVLLGGNASFAGGQGVISMSGGSRIEVLSPAGAPGGMAVGRTVGGSGTLTMSGSHVDVGSANFVIASVAGATGSVTMASGSTVQAGYVGVGRNISGQSTVDTGTASLVVNSGSVVTAQTLEVGAAGYVGGNGTLVANVINHGVFNPGNSPGTLVIDGSFTAGTGGRLVLEVGLDGNGQFVTDQLVFKPGASANLGGLAISFSFLGAADPTAFLASGRFDIDSFVRQQVSDGQGGTTTQGLADSAWGGVSFTAQADGYAIANFQYDPTAVGGAGPSFDAVPVPEPGSAALLAAGVAVLLAWRRAGAPTQRPA